jgi:hypothetical protein
MNQYNEKPISSLVRHCRMYMYASSGSPELMVNEIARDFFTFGLLHLISTMFITTDSRNDPEGGVFHRILDPLGYRKLLDSIDNILDSPVGNTTLRQYIRSKRNKLAVHGSLKFSSQPREVQDVILDDEALNQFKQNMHDLDGAVAVLIEELEKLEN